MCQWGNEGLSDSKDYVTADIRKGPTPFFQFNTLLNSASTAMSGPECSH